MSRKSPEPNMSRYLHRQGRKLGLPISGTFELTARCNFNCPMCYVHLSNEEVRARGGELTAAQWLEIAKAARDKGMVFALLTGGEPLVRPDFFEIYDGMREMGLVLSVNTNGSMLQGKTLERFLEAPPFRFNISLYGGSNETYRNMCGLPVYDQVKQSIRTLREAGVDVAMSLSITPYNRADMAQIYADALDLDVNVKASSYMYPPIRVNDSQFGCGNRLSARESAACAVEWDCLRFSPEEFDYRAENMSKLIRVDQPECIVDEGDGIRCKAGVTSFWMTWDGRMTPCGMMTTPVVYPLEVGFDAAWDQLRSQAAQIRTPAECVGCDHKELCSVCAAVCLTETGSFDKVPEYVCQRTKEIVSQTRQIREERNGK